MSAVVLREAAAKMRERAEAATAGPWHTYIENYEPLVFDQYGTGVQSTASHDVICYSGQVYSRDAEHIASWHPAIALAVADWLEQAAENAERGHGGNAEMRRALAVARAYLGSAS